MILKTHSPLEDGKIVITDIEPGPAKKVFIYPFLFDTVCFIIVLRATHMHNIKKVQVA